MVSRPQQKSGSKVAVKSIPQRRITMESQTHVDNRSSEDMENVRSSNCNHEAKPIKKRKKRYSNNPSFAEQLATAEANLMAAVQSYQEVIENETARLMERKTELDMREDLLGWQVETTVSSQLDAIIQTERERLIKILKDKIRQQMVLYDPHSNTYKVLLALRNSYNET